MNARETVSLLMQEGKGALLVGESNEIEDERLARFGAGSDDARRAYHELLFSTPGIETHLSGVILSPETFAQNASDGTPFPRVIAAKNILVGVSLDASSAPDKFSELLNEYASRGASFAAFTAGVTVSDDPTSAELQKNILALAAGATSALAANIAPLALLDVSMYGAHSSARAEDAMLTLLSLLSDALAQNGVDFKHIVIGVSMATAGSDSALRADSAEVAERSVRALATGIPEETGGVMFLSDAQSAEDATANLNALARLEPLPWPIAFCFSRALQEPVLAAWKASDENVPEAQAIFESRLSLLSRADAAGYSKSEEMD